MNFFYWKGKREAIKNPPSVKRKGWIKEKVS
jgi:hypothetical protein